MMYHIEKTTALLLNPLSSLMSSLAARPQVISEPSRSRLVCLWDTNARASGLTCAALTLNFWGVRRDLTCLL